MLKAEWIQFLVRAKRQTLAGMGEETPSSRPHSHDLAYQEGGLMYMDSCLGTTHFVGEEGLWLESKPLWMMNYAGRILGDEYDNIFLRQALLQVKEDAPYRGPPHFQREGFIYLCHHEGDHSWFQGSEQISHNGVWVYECYFHGATIRE